MADLTPSQFLFLSTGRVTTTYDAAVGVSKGDMLYLTAINEWDLSDNSTSLKSGSKRLAMAREDATIGNPVTVVEGGGQIDLGSAVGVKTDEIVISSTGGKMHPKGDLQSSEYYTSLGYMVTTDILSFSPLVTGVAK